MKIKLLPNYKVALMLLLIAIRGHTEYVSGQGFSSIQTHVSSYRFTTEHGLSQNNVSCIARDRQGFTWIGTGDGLNRFDGYTFTYFSHSDQNPQSLSNNSVRSLLLDSKGRMWVGTYNGLNLFDPEEETFRKFQHDPMDDNSISQNTILTLLEDRNHNLWVGTYWGLNRINLETLEITRYLYMADGSSLADNAINALLEDRNGKIWVCTGKGINIIGPNGFEKMIHPSNDPDGLTTSVIVGIVQDFNGSIYFGTIGDGLLRLNNEDDETFEYFKHIPGKATLGSNIIATLALDRNGALIVGTDGAGLYRRLDDDRFSHFTDRKNNLLANGNIQKLFIDEQNNYWFGLFGAGLAFIPGEQPPFDHYQYFDSNMERLGKNSVLAIAEDDHKKIWIGTDGSGLYRFDPETKQFLSFQHDPSNKNSLSTNVVKSLLVDDKNNLYIGTYAGGLNYLDMRTMTFSRFFHDPRDTTSISTNHVWSLLQTRNKQIYIGQLGGLNEFFPEKRRFRSLTIGEQNPVTSNTASVFSMAEDHNGNIWMGTRLAGVHQYDPGSNTFKSFLDDFPTNEVLTLATDARGNILAGTDNKGLLRIDPHTFAITRLALPFGEKNVPSVVEDESGQVWFTSFDGLHRLNPSSNKITDYTVADGLQGVHFNEGAFLRSSTGDYYVGGTNGLNVFRPELMQEDQSKPHVVFTKLSLFHDPVQINDESRLLKKSIAETQTITFQPDQNVFSIEFACLEYKFPKKNKYRYILEGFDNSWNDINENRTATYTNLPPGKYTLKVSATNNYGFWNEDAASLKIIIIPRWYQLLSVKIGAAFLAVLLVIGLVYARTNFLLNQKRKLEHLVDVRTQLVNAQKEEIKDKNEKLEQAYEEVNVVNGKLQDVNTNLEKVVEKRTEELRLTIKKLIETDAGLNTFLYRSSHDLRGPIASLLGLSRLAKMQSHQEDLAPYFGNIETTALRMLRLLNRLNETAALFRANRNPETISVDDFFQSLLPELNAINACNAVRIEFENKAGASFVSDRKLLTTVVMNLMENSIVFRGEKDPFVKCSLSIKNQNLIIQVLDNGTGIEPHMKDIIFDMFYRGSDRSTGNGLGLFMAKKALEILEGTIDITSEPNKLTTITVCVPLCTNTVSPSRQLIPEATH